MESSKEDINFISSSLNGHGQTFTVKNAPRKKIDLTTIVESLKIHDAISKKEKDDVVARNHNVDPKGKAKLYDDGFIRVKDTRRKFRRPPTGRRPEHVAHKTENKKKSEYVTAANVQPKVSHRGKRNGANKSTRSPPI